MSRELQYDGYWEGSAVYTCDCCKKHYAFPFTNEEEAMDYRSHRAHLRENQGWINTKVNGFWNDFCSEECRNRYIRLNTI